jgi:iron complex outermembrane receptor protein
VPDNPFPQIDAGSTVSRADLEVQQNLSIGPTLRWIWGASIRSDQTAVPLLFDEDRDLLVRRLFTHAEWRATDKLLVNAGAMLEDNELTGTDLAPQLALNYRVAPNHTIRFNLSKALRTPTSIENQSEFNVGPPGTPRFGPSGELLPESILSREISYFGEWPDQHATLDVKLFDDDVQDLIDLVGQRDGAAVGGFPRNAVNGDDARQRGIEAQLVWRPATETLLVLTASHLQTRSDDRLDNYSTSAPRNVAHLLMSRRFAQAWDASVSLHQQSAFRASGLSDPQDSYFRVDTRLARQLPIGPGVGELAITVENLFDNNYTEYRRDVVADRRAWLTFSYALSP